MVSRRSGILVGVTGENDTATLRWAAEEGRRRGAPVTLVHAVGAMPPPLTALPEGATSSREIWEPLARVGRELVGAAVATFAEVNDGTPPDGTLVEPGAPGWLMCELSPDAELLVVGHRPLGGMRRVVTSSTAITVAGHASAPVVVVPHDWFEADREEHGRGWVTVGVHEEAAPSAVLQAAFREAELHDRGVRLVHAWRASSVYDDIVTGTIDPQWRDRVEESLREQARSLLARSEVDRFDVVAVHDWPAEAMTDHSRRSQLLVLGRRSHVGHRPHRLGSIARTLVRTAECPVMVVPV